jgi:hypothetical protein
MGLALRKQSPNPRLQGTRFALLLAAEPPAVRPPMKRILLSIGLGALTELLAVSAIVGSFGPYAYIAAFWAHLPFAILPAAPAGTLGSTLFLAAGTLSWSLVWFVILFAGAWLSRALKSSAV